MKASGLVKQAYYDSLAKLPDIKVAHSIFLFCFDAVTNSGFRWFLLSERQCTILVALLVFFFLQLFTKMQIIALEYLISHPSASGLQHISIIILSIF